MSKASRLPIVLCCAEESEVALVAVVDALHREGYAPEVVPGVETDAGLLTAAADRVRGPALFVLCQSADLDRFQVRRLEGLFSARKGPDHRMVTVEVMGRSAAAIVSEVRTSAREVGRAAGAGGRDEDDGRYMRDVVMPTSVAAVPGVERGPIARSRATPRTPPVTPPIVQAPEGISDEALGLDSSAGDTDTEVVDPLDLHRRSPVPEPDLQLTTDPAARAALEAEGYDVEGPSSDGVPLAIPEDDYPLVGDSSQDAEVRGVPRRLPWGDHSGPVEVERVARPTKADPRAEADDRPLPSASSPIEIGRPTPPPVAVAEPPRERRGARVFLLLFALAGMGGVVTMAVLHATAPIGAGPSDVHERGVPTQGGAPPAEPAPGKAEPAPKPEPPVGATAGATETAKAVVPAEPVAAGSAGGAATDPGGDEGSGGDASSGGDAGGPAGAGDGAAADGGAAAPTEPDAGEPADGETVPKLVPPPPTGGQAAGGDSLEIAIAEGRVRELGELLMVSTGPSTVTWDEASTRCSRRKVAGLGSWKLPTKAQLGDLRRAKLLAPGTYWSRSTVGEDEAFVVDAGSGEASQWLKMEPNGRVVCVRSRP